MLIKRLFFMGIFAVVVGIFVYMQFPGNYSEPTTPIVDRSIEEPSPSSQSLALEVLVSNVPGVRDIEFDSYGNLVASQTSSGNIVVIKNGVPNTILSNLDQPHGIGFANGKIYIALNSEIAVYDYDPEKLTATNPNKIIDLPTGGGHFTRSLLIKDNKLYVSAGSSCNVCNETDERRAAIQVMDLNGDNSKIFATGLRNSVFMTTHPETGDIWATDMGRDNLGDNIPPDEINIIFSDRNYGWPNCYGKNVADLSFNSQADCSASTPSLIDIQAHSAPLGLAFDGPQALYVAYHGSWNRSIPTGYKIVKIDTTSYEEEDFLTEGIERPVDILIRDQQMYISDDKAGKIYRIGL